ncbi:uncharacterized protein [Clytia hemisphaerica]
MLPKRKKRLMKTPYGARSKKCNNCDEMAPVAKVKCPKCQTTFERKGKRIEDYIPPGSVNLTRARYEAKGKLIGIASKEHQHHVVLLDIGPTTADGWGNSPLALEFLNSKQGRLFLPTFKKWLKDKQRTLNTTPADAPAEAEATATNQPMYKASGSQESSSSAASPANLASPANPASPANLCQSCQSCQSC